MNNVLLDEKLELINNSIEVVTKFNLYRRGYLELESCPDPKDIGEALDTLLGVAYEYEDIVRENNALREVMKKAKQEAEKDYVKKVVDNIKSATTKRGKNGENPDQCAKCPYYVDGDCRWGMCDWYTRKAMTFDVRTCCESCSYYNEVKECTYLKEQDKRIKKKEGNKE